MVREELREGSGLFSILAFMPAQASFGLADDLRRRTSGGASAALMLSHWERLQVLSCACHTQHHPKHPRSVCRSCLSLHGRDKVMCIIRGLALGTASEVALRRVPGLRQPGAMAEQVDPFFAPVTEEEREEFGEEGQGRGHR